MWASSTHKFISACVAVCVLAFFVLMVVIAVQSNETTRDKLRSRAEACAIHRANPRDVALCIKLTG